jgi:uncharacterized membrane protein
LIFIAVVFIITVGFSILIARQMKVVSKKALIAKQLQKEYLNQLADDQKEKKDE